MREIRQEHSKFKGKAQFKYSVVDGIKSTKQMIPHEGWGRRKRQRWLSLDDEVGWEINIGGNKPHDNSER